MKQEKSLNVFSNMSVPQAVIQNAIPAMIAMLMVLIYNLADTFFIGQMHNAWQIAAVSLATPVFLMFMSNGTVFGIGGTSVISRAMGEEKTDYAKKLPYDCFMQFSMWFAFLPGFIMTVFCYLFTNQIVSVFLTEECAFDYAVQFARILLSTSTLFGVFYVLTNALQAMGAVSSLVINLSR